MRLCSTAAARCPSLQATPAATLTPRRTLRGCECFTSSSSGKANGRIAALLAAAQRHRSSGGTNGASGFLCYGCILLFQRTDTQAADQMAAGFICESAASRHASTTAQHARIMGMNAQECFTSCCSTALCSNSLMTLSRRLRVKVEI